MTKRAKLTVGGPPPGTREPPKVVRFAPPSQRVFRKTISQLVLEFGPWLSKIGLTVSPEEVYDVIRHLQIGDAENGVVESIIREWVVDEIKKGVTIVDDQPPKKELTKEDYTQIDRELEEFLPDSLFPLEGRFIPARNLSIGQVYEAFEAVFPDETIRQIDIMVDGRRAILRIKTARMSRTYLFDESQSLRELLEKVPRFDEKPRDSEQE